MKDIQEVRQSIDRAATVVSTAHAMITDGKTVDLSGLDGDIAALCAEVTALPREQRLSLKMPLLGLIDGLDRLVDSIRMQHEKLAAALTSTASRRSAVSAYGKRSKGPPRRR